MNRVIAVVFALACTGPTDDPGRNACQEASSWVAERVADLDLLAAKQPLPEGAEVRMARWLVLDVGSDQAPCEQQEWPKLVAHAEALLKAAESEAKPRLLQACAREASQPPFAGKDLVKAAAIQEKRSAMVAALALYGETTACGL